MTKPQQFPSDQPAPQSLMRLPAVIARTGKSRGGIYADIKNGTFPATIPLPGTKGRSKAWIESEVSAWIHQAIKQHRQTEG